ncbi:hypothetical protein CsSME_00044678 [Camellia sinensis var. sinensis]
MNLCFSPKLFPVKTKKTVTVTVTVQPEPPLIPAIWAFLDISLRKLDSPELHPLPPLGQQSFRRNYENADLKKLQSLSRHPSR